MTSLARCDRRSALVGSLAVAGMAALPAGQLLARESAGKWRAAWGAAMQPAPESVSLSPGGSVSQTVAPSLSGMAARIHVSNMFGTEALTVSATVGGRGARFGGLPSITIPPGASVVSDAVELSVVPGTAIEVSIALPEGGLLSDIERTADKTGASLRLSDGATSTPGYPALLSAVDILGEHAPVIAVLGDTKSSRPDSWVDLLATQSKGRAGIVNRSVFAGKLALGEGPSSGLARFDHDVLGTAGVTDLLLFCGNNDLIQPGMIGSSGKPALDPALMLSFEQLKALMGQAVDRARTAGVRAIAATWLPYEGVTIAEGYSTPEKMALRVQLNEWMRAPGVFDRVIDFDAALRDPERPSRLDPRYDNGNHFTPNQAGVEHMAQAAAEALFAR